MPQYNFEKRNTNPLLSYEGVLLHCDWNVLSLEVLLISWEGGPFGL
jgi:hypothetical protein